MPGGRPGGRGRYPPGVDCAPVPCLLGPTASGKSDVVLALARRTQGEIVSCDAFSVYRGMAILTAAPDPSGDVPHHLVAEREPTRPWSAALFVEACDAHVASIRARGHQPWIAGGTALYLRAWLKGFGAPVARDAAYRASLLALAEAEGPAALHARLEGVDPDRARALHPNDVRRVVRALEIVKATGRPASAQRGQWTGPDRRAARLVGLRRRQDDLDARIALRTEAMFAAGVVEEARRLLAGPLSPEAAKVLGLDVLRRLLAGELDEEAARAAIAQKTRRFARKQMTFFRSFEAVHWIDVPPRESPDVTATRILEATGSDQATGTSS